MSQLVKKQCEELADKLAKRLKEKVGGDWQPEVWNNLGWHYKVGLGSIGVYTSHGHEVITYSVMVTDKIGNTSAGSVELCNLAEDKLRRSDKPEDVVEAALYALKTAAENADMLYKSNLQLLKQA